MFTRIAVAATLAFSFAAGPLLTSADAASNGVSKYRTQVAKPKPGNFSNGQRGQARGAMDGWPQTLDDLENAYNCGPYADKESAKKCKD